MVFCYEVTFAWENSTALSAVTRQFKSKVAAWPWPNSRYLAALWLSSVPKESFFFYPTKPVYTSASTARRCTFTDDLSRMFFANFPSVHSNDLPAAHSTTTLAVAPSKHPELQCPIFHPVAYRGGGVQTPPPKFWRPSKIVPKSTRLWKLLKIAEFRTPTHQDVRKKCSKILKLPKFAIILHQQWQKKIGCHHSLKVPKIKKILLYEKKFLVPNYSCLQNPWLEGYAPRSPFSLSPALNWICWTHPRENSWVRHWQEGI